MPGYIAFLRAINVGGHTVKMDRLRQLFTELALTKVETFIASGNVYFESGSKNQLALEKTIEKKLHDQLGYEVRTFVRTPAQLDTIVGNQTFPAKDMSAPGHRLYIGFLAKAPSAEAKLKLMAAKNEEIDFAILGNEVYWLLRVPFSDSRFTGAHLEKTLGMPVTIRNLTTLKKLAAKYLVA